jgi:hypothetical protein
VRIYEINTWVWLSELSERYARPVTLEAVPDAEWDALTVYHFDAVWLMGVWQRSAVGRRIAQADAQVVAKCREVFPGLQADDVVASPYCVHSYTVDEKLGGSAGLSVARAQLAKRGLKLVLDFVPNHTALDHPWTILHPEYYILGTTDDSLRDPHRFYRADGDVTIARGATSREASQVWTDTAQLNAFSPGYRDAALLTLLDIARQCDSVRCDMAMLMLNPTFGANWSVGPAPAEEFWVQVIGHVRRRYPEFTFIAESYSDTEWILQQQGFDFCYDKDRLYERLASGDADSIRQHLQFSSAHYLGKLVHFLENHDEQAAQERFRPAGRHQLAAMAIATLPGASLWYDRQFEGRWGQLPVQLARSLSIRAFYQRLLQATAHAAIRTGTWAWCPVEPAESILAWSWTSTDKYVLVVLNMSDSEAWGRVRLPWGELKGRQCRLNDLFTGEVFGPRDGSEIVDNGLLVGRPAWGFHLFEINRST